MKLILSLLATFEDILCIILRYKRDLAAKAESIEEGIECLTSILCVRSPGLDRGMHEAGFGTYAGHVIMNTDKNVVENRCMDNLG